MIPNMGHGFFKFGVNISKVVPLDGPLNILNSKHLAFAMVIPVEIDVYHAYTIGAFSKICQRLNLDEVEEIASDIWFYNITSRNIQLGGQVLDRIGHVRFGYMESFEADVKILLITYIFSETCFKLYSSNNHENIRMFLGAQVDNIFYGVAFEYCPHTLADYVGFHGGAGLYDTQNLLSGLAKGLGYLHRDQKICHGNLNPWNVLIFASGVVKNFGLTKCTTHNTRDEVEDFKALRKLIAFCFNEQRDPDEGRYKGSVARLVSMSAWARDAKDISTRLLAGRASLNHVIAHTSLWRVNGCFRTMRKPL